MAEGDGAAVGAVVVLWEIETLWRAEWAGDIGENGGRNAVHALHGEQVGEGLEGGAGRAWDERAIELAAARVVPGGGRNEGENFSGRVVDDDNCGVAEIGGFEFGGFLADDGFDVALEWEVEGGGDLRFEI